MMQKVEFGVQISLGHRGRQHGDEGGTADEGGSRQSQMEGRIHPVGERLAHRRGEDLDDPEEERDLRDLARHQPLHVDLPSTPIVLTTDTSASLRGDDTDGRRSSTPTTLRHENAISRRDAVVAGRDRPRAKASAGGRGGR